MIFEEIELNNIFSYFKIQRLDLRGRTDSRNIFVISGRNGYGKTNFINSLKLLFGGVTDELKSEVGAGRKFSNKKYIMGEGDDWAGILNRKAYKNGEKSCWVQVRWLEESGHVRAQRRWDFSNNDCKETIEVQPAFLDQTLYGEDAQNLLKKRLPDMYLPFFFFDGEKVRLMAHMDHESLKKQIEYILNIKHIDTLIEYLGKVASDWKRNAATEAERHKLEALEADIRLIDAEIKAVEEEQLFNQNEIDELQQKINEERNFLESALADESRRDADKLNSRRDQLRYSIDKLKAELAERMPLDLPLLSAPLLVKKALREITDYYKSSDIPPHLRENLVDQLPEKLFDQPPFPEPPLIDAQAHFLKDRLRRLVQENFSDNQTTVGTWGLERIDVATLEGLLDFYNKAEHLRKQTHTNLIRLRAEKAQLVEVEEALQDAVHRSTDEQQAYRTRLAQNREREEQLDKLREIKANRGPKQNALLAKKRQIQTERDAQLETVALSEKAREKYDLSRRLKMFFEEFKARLKSHYREELETALNSHFKTLMTSHTGISRIYMDDDFRLHYQDESGDPMSQGSFSEGMKQIAAIALLWALKDVSNKTVPVVVDTPLARIDLEHQRNMLTHYFPKAAEQVILLPTDSELDRLKYERIKPCIYGERRLINEDGQTSTFLDEPMWS